MMQVENTTPKSNLYIALEDYAKLFLWAKTAVDPQHPDYKFEIGGYGRYNPDSRLISGLFLIEQEAGMSDVDFDMTKLAPIIQAAPASKRSHYRVWWHSHGSHPVMFSKTDLEHIDSWGLSIDYVISIVVNYAGDVYCRVDYYRPIRSFILCNLLPNIALKQNKIEELQAEVKAKVKFKMVQPTVVITGRGVERQGEIPFQAGHYRYIGAGGMLISEQVSDKQLEDMARGIIDDDDDFDDWLKLPTSTRRTVLERVTRGEDYEDVVLSIFGRTLEGDGG